jgi:hypothetical protein
MSQRDLRERSASLITARKWGVSLVCSLLGLGLFASEAKRISALPWDPSNLAYLVLLFTTGVLIFIWIWATQKEMDLLFDWMDPERYEPPSDFKETAIIISLGILLVGLIYAARDPVAYGIVFTAYSIFVLFATKRFERELVDVIDRSRTRMEKKGDARNDELEKLYLKGIAILEHYFLKRPQRLRHSLIVSLSIVGLVLALWSKHVANSVFAAAAYIVYITTVVVSEVVIGCWRNRRDEQLRPITAEIKELERQPASSSPLSQ